MELHNWLVFMSIVGLVSISPGPNVLAVVIKTVEGGLRGAFFTILGNLIALFSIALAAAIGVGAMLQAAPSAFTVMKITGGLYLAWMGFKMFKKSFGKPTGLELNLRQETRTKNTSLGYILNAMLITYSNPKSILFLSAVFPTFLDETKAMPLQFGIMFTTIIMIVLFIHGTYAAIAFRMKNELIGTRVRKWMARLSGISFIGFGAGFIYDAQK